MKTINACSNPICIYFGPVENQECMVINEHKRAGHHWKANYCSLKMDERKYSRICYMIRASAINFDIMGITVISWPRKHCVQRTTCSVSGVAYPVTKDSTNARTAIAGSNVMKKPLFFLQHQRGKLLKAPPACSKS